MYNYILFTYDALLEFASGRTFQSAEFSQSEQLCNILMQRDNNWFNPTIYVEFVAKNGVIFYTKNIDKKRGLLFDFETFKGFQNHNADMVITIFQKVIKYAIRYFDGQPLAPCEHNVTNTTAIVYPFPFTATKDVEKVFIDKNSSKQNRNEQNYLVAFCLGIVPCTFQTASLNKAVEALKEINIQVNEQKSIEVDSLKVYQMDNPSLSINATLCFEQWLPYLTKTQKEFINRPIQGAERLEGPAGSGKTLSLILRCIFLMEEHHKAGTPYKIIYITHSIATKDRITELFVEMYPKFENHKETEDDHPEVSILITTLQEWSKNNLGANIIYDTEMIDKDAGISKSYQLMMIEDAYDNVKNSIWKGYQVICSPKFVQYINQTPIKDILDMLQYEISVVIKGRADGNLEKYKQIERPLLGIPLNTNEDKGFIFKVYEKYQQSLERSGVFDTDDITLSALGQLDTPIWKRRSIKEGYDACFIDEAHLFNFNELSVFHYLNKPDLRNHIIYVLDKSQYTGEVGFTERELASLTDGSDTHKTKLATIFRSSPSIINLAFNVLSSNVSLFTHFENPLDHCFSSFTMQEERKCKKPEYKLFVSDDKMVKEAFIEAEKYCDQYKLRKSDVLIVVSDNLLLNNVVLKYLRSCNKPFVEIQGRNVFHSIKEAKNDNKFVVCGIDYVGGLEFDVVFILGVDKSRVPPEGNENGEHYQFNNYAWHNRMYVAISRAKYYVAIYGNSQNGISSVLETAVSNNIIDLFDENNVDG